MDYMTTFWQGENDYKTRRLSDTLIGIHQKHSGSMSTEVPHLKKL